MKSFSDSFFASIRLSGTDLEYLIKIFIFHSLNNSMNACQTMSASFGDPHDLNHLDAETTVNITSSMWLEKTKQSYQLKFLFSFPGVRSLSFLSTVMTIGTGMGSIMFYDLRINRFLERADGSPCFLKVGRGWLVSFIFLIGPFTDILLLIS